MRGLVEDLGQTKLQADKRVFSIDGVPAQVVGLQGVFEIRLCKHPEARFQVPEPLNAALKGSAGPWTEYVLCAVLIRTEGLRVAGRVQHAAPFPEQQIDRSPALGTEAGASAPPFVSGHDRDIQPSKAVVRLGVVFAVFDAHRIGKGDPLAVDEFVADLYGVFDEVGVYVLKQFGVLLVVQSGPKQNVAVVEQGCPNSGVEARLYGLSSISR